MKEFTHYNQPYGTVTFTVESVTPVAELMKDKTPDPFGSGAYLFHRAKKGWLELKGTVVQGSETSRLFHATHTKDLSGKPYSLQVPPEAYAQGEYTTVAM